MDIGKDIAKVAQQMTELLEGYSTDQVSRIFSVVRDLRVEIEREERRQRSREVDPLVVRLAMARIEKTAADKPRGPLPPVQSRPEEL